MNCQKFLLLDGDDAISKALMALCCREERVKRKNKRDVKEERLWWWRIASQFFMLAFCKDFSYDGIRSRLFDGYFQTGNWPMN
jgi:hypothetical protein